MGIRPSAVATLVERASRYTAIVALPDGIKVEQVTPHLTRSLLGIPPPPAADAHLGPGPGDG
nr:hypothetical protein [Streptomyces javensis]